MILNSVQVDILLAFNLVCCETMLDDFIQWLGFQWNCSSGTYDYMGPWLVVSQAHDCIGPWSHWQCYHVIRLQWMKTYLPTGPMMVSIPVSSACFVIMIYQFPSQFTLLHLFQDILFRTSPFYGYWELPVEGHLLGRIHEAWLLSSRSVVQVSHLHEMPSSKILVPIPRSFIESLFEIESTLMDEDFTF